MMNVIGQTLAIVGNNRGTEELALLSQTPAIHRPHGLLDADRKWYCSHRLSCFCQHY